MKTGLAFVICLIAGLILGWFVGERYTTHRILQQISENVMPVPLIDAKEIQANLDAKKRYLKENVHLKIGLADHESGKSWFLRGNVENAGNRDIQGMELTIHFLDNSGKVCGNEPKSDPDFAVKSKSNHDFSVIVSPPDCWAQKPGTLDYQVTQLALAK